MGTYKEQNYETKSMISASLKKLMKTKPFNKITVKQIIDDCGIVRNTFYYHFEDTTDLLRWTLREDALKKIPSIETNKDLGLVIDGFCSFVLDNRSLMLSIADSLSYYDLKRVFYSAYVPVNKDKLLPSISIPPLTRENRLYQADWLLRFYDFKVSDLLDNNNPNFNLLLDPKCDWALRHLNEFPKEVNKVSYNDLLKIPGIGVKSAMKIIRARRVFKISFDDLKKMGVSIKRAKYFILCNGKYFLDNNMFKESIIKNNLILDSKEIIASNAKQLCMWSE